MTALAGSLQTFWIGMAQHLWQTALFLALLAAVAWTLRRTSARLLSVLYWIGVLKLALPLPLLGPAATRLLQGGAAPAGDGGTAGWALTTRLLYPAMAEGSSVRGPGLWTIVCVVLTASWLVGAALIVLRRWRSGSPVRRLVLRRADRGTDTSPARLRTLLSELGLPSGSVRMGNGFSVPFVWGALRPKIVIPEMLLDALEPDDLRAVLIHEHEHVRRRDPLRYTVLATVLALFWFYPLTWWLARRIRETAEMACDEAAMRRGLPGADYCRSLARTLRLGLIPQPSAPAAVFGDRPSFLRSRLERVRSGRRFEIMTAHRVGVGAALCMALVASLLPLAPVTGLRAAGDPSAGTLHELAEPDLPITLVFKSTPPEEVLDILARVADLDFHIVGRISQEPIDIELRDSTLVVALQHLATLAGLRYNVVGPRELEVRGVMRGGVHGVTYPTLIEEFKVLPAYPEEARQDSLEGKVILEAIILHDGSVGNLRLLRIEPEGFTPFADSAMEAVSQWQYEPGLQDDVPVDVYFAIVIEFVLRDDDDDEEL